MVISGPKNWIFTHYIYVVFIDKPHYIMKISLTPEWVKNAQATAIPYCYVIGTHNGRWISDKMIDLFIILVRTEPEEDLRRALIDYWPAATQA